MRPLDQLKRRFLNFCWLQYSPAELWEFVRLRWTRRRIPASFRHYPYPWHGKTLYFDGILVISLPFRQDRRVRIRQQMSHFGLSYAFLEAIHGQSLNPATMDQTRFTRSTLRYLPKGSLGCALSHIRAWQQVLDQGWQYGLIFEDDVILTETFVEDLRARMPEVPPDFDLLYLGSGLTAPHHVRAFVSTHVFEPHYPREGMYAYVVSAKGAHKLLEKPFPMHMANGGIDTAVGKLVRKRMMKAYHFLPPLCRADLETPSNVPNPGGKTKRLDSREG
jgi:glycosyl transferase family 25